MCIDRQVWDRIVRSCISRTSRTRVRMSIGSETKDNMVWGGLLCVPLLISDYRRMLSKAKGKQVSIRSSQPIYIFVSAGFRSAEEPSRAACCQFRHGRHFANGKPATQLSYLRLPPCSPFSRIRKRNRSKICTLRRICEGMSAFFSLEMVRMYDVLWRILVTGHRFRCLII